MIGYPVQPVDDSRVVVLGRYWARPATAARLSTRCFAHIITLRGDRVAALQQITDTASWGIRSAL
jgi:uncharacterized protein